MVTGTQRGVWGTAGWLVPRDAGRAAMGDEAENRVAIGITEGPEYQVSAWAFCCRHQGACSPGQWGKMEGGCRRKPWGAPGWLLGTDSKGESWAL